MIKKLNSVHKDKRGRIIDIFTNQPKEHCTLVTFNKNAVRGNHYHKKSTQFSFVISGKLLMITTKVNHKGQKIGKVKKKILHEHSLVTHKPCVAHTFKALKKSTLLAFVNGRRGGKNYEKDTFRLKEKLI